MSNIRLFFTSMLILASVTLFSLEFTQSYLDEIGKKFGDDARKRLVGWEKLVKENQKADEKTKLEKVNIFFNLMNYYSDINHWGKEDYWATPLEFVVSGGGDCEDYTIAKYFTLLELGIPDEKLLITYVKALELNQAHMVLSYYPTPDAVPLILDNLNKELLPGDQRTDLKPVYGFNGKGLWAAKELGLGHKVANSDDYKRWTDLKDRMKDGKIIEGYSGDDFKPTTHVFRDRHTTLLIRRDDFLCGQKYARVHGSTTRVAFARFGDSVRFKLVDDDERQ
jgi:predicted transglutaminase-like cysteine proteinase